MSKTVGEIFAEQMADVPEVLKNDKLFAAIHYGGIDAVEDLKHLKDYGFSDAVLVEYVKAFSAVSVAAIQAQTKG